MLRRFWVHWWWWWLFILERELGLLRRGLVVFFTLWCRFHFMSHPLCPSSHC